ncbi:MAG: RES family NAD+ phosphorylase [Clostridia bacterium]|nr:RES family NAD+ phosphorylase [Clostridia bacterium]
MKIETHSINAKKIYDYYFDAELELKNKNRFSNEKLDKIVDFLINFKVNETLIKKGTILYRARIYDEFDAEERYIYPSTNNFKGYDEKNSYVNLNNHTIMGGRCNPAGIICLYASNSIQCCIHEIRPNIGEYVSVASIEVCNRLNMLDLSTDTIIPGTTNPCEIEHIARCQFLFNLFKRPYQYRDDYLITQYISEKIKNHGFDGIKYTSSLYCGGENTNYVIFSYKKCHAIDSKLYKIVANQIVYE